LQEQKRKQKQKQQQQQRQQQIDQVNRFDLILERQIDEITEGFSNVYVKNLRTLSENNIKTIVRYIAALRIETSLSTHYRRDIIDLLTKFAIYHNNNNNKQFKDATRDDVINFLKFPQD
jgi:signal recognition particle GTPase